MKGNFAAFFLIALGSFWLLSNLGLLNLDLVSLARTWWPAILIGVGVALLATNREKKRDTSTSVSREGK